ncbi:MAG: hypothetical protein U0P45_12680 [Acidimicrobiales bacterium]
MKRDGDDFAELGGMLDDLEAQIASLQPNEELDRQLIRGLHACDLSDVDIDRLARRLRPFMRAHIMRGALWRGWFAENGGELGWVPVWPIEVAVEVCAYPSGDPVPDNLVGLLAPGLTMDLEERVKVFRTRGMAEISWRKEVELRLIQAAIDTPECLETRKELEEVAASGELPEALQLVASDRELSLVLPLWSLAHHYPVLSDDESFPEISNEWWQQRGRPFQEWT